MTDNPSQQESPQQLDALRQRVSQLELMTIESQRAEESLNETLHFEALMTDLSAAFVNLPTSRIDDEIRSWLKRIVEILKIDRASIFQRSDNQPGIWVSRSWAAVGMELSRPMALDAETPWMLGKMVQGETAFISSLDKMPEEAQTDKPFFQGIGTKSAVLIPLLIEKTLVGIIAIGSVHAERDWPERLVQRLGLVGRVFAAALARKKAENALRQSEKKYRRLFESANDAILIIRGDRVIDCNEHTLRVFRCTREHIIDRALHELSPEKQPDGPSSPERAMEKLNAVSAGRSQFLKWRFLRRDNSVLDTEVSLSRLELDEEHLILAVVRDITERRHSLETMQALINAPTESAILIDIEGKILAINDIAAQRIGGRGRDEMVGSNLFDHLSFSMAESRRRKIDEVIELGKPLRFEDERDGRYYYNSFYPVFNIDRKIMALAIYATDVTEQRRAQKALQENEERLRLAQEAAGMVTFEWNLQTGDMIWSDNAYREFNLAPETTSGSFENYLQMIHPQDRKGLMQALDRVLNSDNPGDEISLKYRLTDVTGKMRWAAGRGKLWRDDGGRPYRLMGLLMDISERIMAEEELKAEREALQEKNIALRQILNHMEQERIEYKHEIASNMENLLVPVVEKLRKTDGFLSKREIDLLDNSVQSIAGKDIHQFRNNYGKLTSRELDVCENIKTGLSSKEIAETLNISVETVHKHRESIRRKLQIKHRNLNLSAYLRSKMD